MGNTDPPMSQNRNPPLLPDPADACTGGLETSSIVLANSAELRLGVTCRSARSVRMGRVRRWVSTSSTLQAPHQAHRSGAGSRLPATWGRMARAQPVACYPFRPPPRPEGGVTEPSVLENQPQVQAAQAVGRTCSSSTSWRISTAG
jgi:hypothetical protein